MVMIKMASSGEDYAKVFALVEPVLKLRPRTQGGETILHLAVSSSSTLKSRNFMDDDSFALFPSADVADFFLRCGFDVHSRNFHRGTPLHTVCKKENFSREAVQVLLRHGAHLDVFDEDDVTPLDLLRKAARKSSGDSICSAKHLTLKCLSAQALMAMKKPHPELGLLPYTLQEFLYLHKRNKRMT
jgi:ankyrin repeat protein